MGVGYILVNRTRREQIRFMHVAATTAREIAGNPAAAAITTWYLLQHPGDEISFVTDSYGEWPFQGCSRSELDSYSEVTDLTIDQLIKAEILADHGKNFVAPEDPAAVYERDLRNVWWPVKPS